MNTKKTDNKITSAVSVEEQIVDNQVGIIDSSSNIMMPMSLGFGILLIVASVFYSTNKIMNRLDSLEQQIASQGASLVNVQAGAQQDNAEPTGPVNVTYKPTAPFEGNADAKVTVVAYADFQCPFCGKFHQDVYPSLKTKYIDTGKIKFVYQDWAFLGQESFDAAEAAKCAQDQGKFWEYYDYLYDHQNGENKGAFAVTNLKKFAAALGLNGKQFNQCLDAHTHLNEVKDETKAGTSYGITGTPTIFVNGNRIKGAQPAIVFEQAIESALNK